VQFTKQFFSDFIDWRRLLLTEITSSRKDQSAFSVLLRRQGIFIALLLLIGISAIISKEFLSIENIFIILRQVAVEGVIAIGMTFVVISGNLDLSVGATLSLSGVLAIGLQPQGMLLGILIGISVGAIIGIANGLAVSYLKANSLITTMGMTMVIQAIGLLYTKGQMVRGSIEIFEWFGKGKFYGIPIPVVIWLILVVIFHILLTRTSYGRQLAAVGYNKEAARVAGVKSDSIVLISFIICGILAAIGGVILASRVNSASPLSGAGYEFRVLTAVIVGGASLNGGRGNIIRTALGAFFMGIVSNIIVLAGLPYQFQLMTTGFLILAAVLLDIFSQRKMEV
jgi:ribose transport system permease protein